MPTYDYECADCGPFSEVRPMAEFDRPQPCPDCARRHRAADGAGARGRRAGSVARRRPGRMPADARAACRGGCRPRRFSSATSWAWTKEATTSHFFAARMRAQDHWRRRSTASLISGMRSLPKYMSSPPTKIVGEPKLPRSIASCVLARSVSLTGCCSMAASSLAESMSSLPQISVRTGICEISLSSVQ